MGIYGVKYMEIDLLMKYYMGIYHTSKIVCVSVCGD